MKSSATIQFHYYFRNKKRAGKPALFFVGMNNIKFEHHIGA